LRPARRPSFFAFRGFLRWTTRGGGGPKKRSPPTILKYSGPRRPTGRRRPS
jgi:hypothetical protein